MSKYYKELKEKFQEIKDAGWHKATRDNDTGIGKTFEDLLDKNEDNISAPDYEDIEVKSQRALTSSMLTLFTKSPTYPRGINSFLREEYGNYSEKYVGKKILFTTISAKKFNTHVSGHDFKIKVDRDNKRLVLQIRKNDSKAMVFENAYWSFDVLAKTLEKKLKHIAYVTADVDVRDGINYFNYRKIQFINDFTFENFLIALENGDLFIDIRIGVYGSGKKEGKTHDYGTGFRIQPTKLLEYANTIEI